MMHYFTHLLLITLLIFRPVLWTPQLKISESIHTGMQSNKVVNGTEDWDTSVPRQPPGF